MQLSVVTPDRPDSEQQQLQTVQEPVLVLTTSHILILEQGHQPVAVLPLQGMPALSEQGFVLGCHSSNVAWQVVCMLLL